MIICEISTVDVPNVGSLVAPDSQWGSSLYQRPTACSETRYEGARCGRRGRVTGERVTPRLSEEPRGS